MRKRTAIIAGCAVVLLVAAAGAYTGIGMYYRTHFFEHTAVNGIDVSDLTAEEAEALVAHQAETYSLTVQTRDGAQEILDADALGYHFVSDGEVSKLLKDQNAFLWLPAYFGAVRHYTMAVSVDTEKDRLEQSVHALACMQEDAMIKPVDASVALQDGTYIVVPETEGSYLNESKVVSAVEAAVAQGETTVDLATEGCYEEPKVRSDSSALKAEAAVKNKYSSIAVTYQMGCGITETLDAQTTAGWFTFDENSQPVLDEAAASAWVDALADRYDTLGTMETFQTTNKELVSVEARTYGWQMDRDTEKAALIDILKGGESTERTVTWLEGAWTRGENDIGNTYVEIDYTNQHMWFYKDGVLLVDTAVVTGNVSAGTSSPEGIFCLVGKSEHETLKGEGYSTPVDYWMPFYGGVGIHDADSWRSVYGGTIYQTSGSHGCINTPTAKVAVIYANIEIGTPIVCYSSGINYGYPNESGGGQVQTETTAQPESQNQTDAPGQTDSDIVIIGGDGTTQQGVTQDGVPYTGQDLQNIIIQ